MVVAKDEADLDRIHRVNQHRKNREFDGVGFKSIMEIEREYCKKHKKKLPKYKKLNTLK